MNGNKSRETIYSNMDAMSLLYDARDILEISLNRMTKIINKGKEYNQILEVNTRQRIA